MLQHSHQYVLSVIKTCYRPELPEVPGFFLDEAAWQSALLYAARWQLTLPFVRRVQSTVWYPSLPEGARLTLEERVGRERVRMAVLDRELDNALFGLLHAGVAPVVLGGMDWGRRFYSNRLDRPTNQVELMVQNQDWWTAMQALGRSGYRISRETPEFCELGPQLKIYRSSMMPGAWARAKEGLLVGLPESCLALGPEDAWVFSLMTRGGLGWKTPLWLTDLTSFLQQESQQNLLVDWNLLLRLCQQQNFVAANWAVLEFLGKNWAAPIPTAARTLIQKNIGPIRKFWISYRLAENQWFPVQGKKPRKILRHDGVWQTLRSVL